MRRALGECVQALQAKYTTVCTQAESAEELNLALLSAATFGGFSISAHTQYLLLLQAQYRPVFTQFLRGSETYAGE